jgi:acyl-CoA synthetase (AMP-forming)/AMP-acid ligase II
MKMKMTVEKTLDINAHNYPFREAVIFEDARITYAGLNTRVNQKANAFLSLGVKKGTHVGTLFFNCMEVVESVFALLRIGAVVVPLNIRLSEKELAYIVDQSGVSILVFQDQLEELARKIKPVCTRVRLFVSSGRNPSPEFADLEKETLEQPGKNPGVALSGMDPATIIYTAGTTGRPKGVVSTHDNWMWAVLNYIIALNSRNDKSLTVFPLFHAAAFAALFVAMADGATQIFMREFNPAKVLEMIEKEKVTRLGNPPTVYRMLLQVPNISDYDLSSVLHLGSGSESIPDDTRNRLKKVFPNAGILENYGMTETCGGLTTRFESDTDTKPYSVGLPHFSVKIRVVDEQGLDVRTGETGEIIASGPNIMKEYYKNPEKTAEALRDGWLYTGDLGRYDEDGFLYIIERKHHMIISGGENIYPKEVEDVLFRHPKIAEAAVFGLPDEIWGERVCAAVVVKEGEKLESMEVIEFCKENLAGFKKPKAVFFVDTLPKSSIGKALRSELKKQFSG